MEPSPTHQPTLGARALPLLLLFCLLTVIAGGFVMQRDLSGQMSGMRVEIEQLAAEVRSSGDVVHLMRMERGSEGLGIEAVITQIRFWAPKLQLASTMHAEVPGIRDHLQEANRAIAAIGAEASAPLEEAFATETNDEVRKALLLASHAADPRHGELMMERTLRATHYSPSARMRFIACDQLLEVNRPRAAQTLADILRTEATMGVDRPINARDTGANYLNPMGAVAFPQFFNLIARFANSGYADTEAVLMMILGREKHNVTTYRECIRELARLKSRDAVKRIQELCLRPPGFEIRPLFKNACLQALADILGKEAEPFFQETLRTAQHETVIIKLQSLIKKFS